MKTIHFFAATAIALGTIFTSCKKDEPTVDASANTSSSLTAGRSGIYFTSNANFVTNAAFKIRNTTQTAASSTISGTYRYISLTAIEFTSTNNIDTRTANVSIQVPVASTTAQGNLVSDLSVPTSETRIAHVTLSSNAGTTAGTTYNSNAGTLTITKLTSTEIEGTFNATVKEAGAGTSTMVLSNGSFAGKFQ